ncbi:MAG: hypothetical protein GXP58_01225 [Deltaproteobacteria bacterium]|nr:hypothetical protein [Deltaproteobacteria bacterium]
MFEKLVAAQDLRVESHRCIRARYPRGECRVCADICPVQAVDVQGDRVILRENCAGCEACLVACPTGVFSCSSVRERKRRTLLQQQAAGRPSVRFTCAMDLQKNGEGVQVLPCLAGLPPSFLVAPFVWGSGRVEIKRIDCRECPLEPAMAQYRQTLQQVCQLLSRFPDWGGEIVEVESFVKFAERESRPVVTEGMGRREFFGLFRRRTMETALNLFPDTVGEARKVRWEGKGDPRRLFLLTLLAQLGTVREGPIPGGILPTLDLKISENCVGCNVCETLCPTGALRREEQEDSVRLYLTPSGCVGCRICGEACLPKAITFSEQISLASWLQRKERLLAEVSARYCSVCGEPFIGIPGKTCSRCIGSLKSG